MDAIQSLADDLREARWAGKLHFIVEPNNEPQIGDIIHLLDDFVQRHGMTGLGAQWDELNRTDAARHLVSILHRDMAYDMEIMPLERAEELTARFVDLFPDAHFFSNCAPDVLGFGSNPITAATFDTGIIAVGTTSTGMIWVEDED
jgi:hypothetical protein